MADLLRAFKLAFRNVARICSLRWAAFLGPVGCAFNDIIRAGGFQSGCGYLGGYLASLVASQTGKDFAFGEVG